MGPLNLPLGDGSLSIANITTFGRNHISYTPGTTGTLWAEFVMPQAGTALRILGSNGANDVAPLFVDGTGTVGSFNGVSSVTKVALTLVPGNIVRCAVSWGSGFRGVAVNGLTGSSDTGAFGTFTQLWFGRDNSGAFALGAPLRRVWGDATQRTLLQLEALTA